MRRIGILGGGQLGRMLAEESRRAGVEVATLDAPGCPASLLSNNRHTIGSFKNAADVRRFAEQVDVLTVEIEHIDTKVLEELANAGKEIQPDWQTLRTIQDKFEQKQLLASQNVSLAPYAAVQSADGAGVRKAADTLGGFPIMLKARRDAYDGRGNYVVRNSDHVETGLKALAGKQLYAEKLLDFRMELAVMVVKTKTEAVAEESSWMDCTVAYPAVETVHKDSICQTTYCPPRTVDKDIVRKAEVLARKAVAAFKGRGAFGVELFLTKDNKLLVNEIAPRVHNTGHCFMSPAVGMSQFEAHLRAVAGRPILPQSLASTGTAVIMLNILGGAEPDSHKALEKLARTIDTADVYMYGKTGKPGRKVGHINITASTMAEAEQALRPLLELSERIRREANEAKAKASQLLPSTTTDPAAAATFAAPSPAQLQSGIVVTMGSKSDLPVLKAGIDYLQAFSLTPYVTITSAHRTPKDVAALGEFIERHGFKVAIAAAGGAAHLPGMLAAQTDVQVIGVPVKPSIGDGTDSLLSIVNMPRGCAVATVGVNNSTNAAQLAVRLLAASDPGLRQRFNESLEKQKIDVQKTARDLEQLGVDEFLGKGS